MNKTLLLTTFSAAALVAQGPQIVEDKQIHVIAAPATGGGAAGAFTWMSAETSFEAALVKGVPFAGDFVTENSQTLADGNRIRNTNTTSYARDGEGRTRREITIDMIGPFTGGAAKKTIFIHDPVAKVDYVLDPETMTARKINVSPMFTKMLSADGKEGPGGAVSTRVAGTREATTMVFDRRPAEGREITIPDSGENRVSLQRMPLPPGMVMRGDAGAVVRQGIVIADPAMAATAATNIKTEPLGKRIIEGVEADGTRSTLTIPAGQIGNDRALDTVSERWYSNELKTVVLTTRKDPRTGESTYKLVNLRRGEPARYLFEVPGDYKLIEENSGGNVIRMRVEKKEE